MNRFGKAKMTAALMTVCAFLSAADTAEADAEKPEAAPQQPGFRICVIDFVQADIAGQKRFLDQESKPIVIPPQCTLTQEDRMTMNAVMQGFVRMIDARDNARTNEANRRRMTEDNIWERRKALDLFHTVVKGESRPVILGAERLGALLSRYSDVFSCTDASLMMQAMTQLQKDPDFPQDFLRKLAEKTGATHMLCGTVSDLRIKTKTFTGYGIETTNCRYELDFTYKLVDLNAQHTVYGNVQTGVKTEQKLPGVVEKEPALFQTLLNDALTRTAEELYRVCKPGKDCRVPAPAPAPAMKNDGSPAEPGSAQEPLNKG